MLKVDKEIFLSNFTRILTLNEWVSDAIRPINEERLKKGKKELDLAIKERLDLISAVLYFQKIEDERNKEKRQLILFYLRITGFVAGPIALIWTLIDKLLK